MEKFGVTVSDREDMQMSEDKNFLALGKEGVGGLLTVVSKPSVNLDLFMSELGESEIGNRMSSGEVDKIPAIYIQVTLAAMKKHFHVIYGEDAKFDAKFFLSELNKEFHEYPVYYTSFSRDGLDKKIFSKKEGSGTLVYFRKNELCTNAIIATNISPMTSMAVRMDVPIIFGTVQEKNPEGRPFSDENISCNSYIANGKVYSRDGKQILSEDYGIQAISRQGLPKLYQHLYITDRDLIYNLATRKKTRVFKNSAIFPADVINKALCEIIPEDRASLGVEMSTEDLRIVVKDCGREVSFEELRGGARHVLSFLIFAMYTGGLRKGDVVLLRDMERSLYPIAQQRLFKFLQDFGEKNGILFIQRTYSPFMLNMNNFRNIRILRKDSEGRYEIINDISTIVRDVQQLYAEYILGKEA